jgi:ribonuclease T2
LPSHPPLKVAAALAALIAAASPAAAGGIAGEFDFYVLSMAWSARPCGHDAGGHGFDFAGLTPRYEVGAPTECPTLLPARLSKATLAGLVDLMPKSLAMEQWASGGVCTGLRAAAYFDLARDAIATVVIPPELTRPGVPERLTPRQIEQMFVAANPGMPADGLSVACRQGVFAGVSVCLTRGLGFRSCGEARAGSCSGGSLAVPEVD